MNRSGNRRAPLDPHARITRTIAVACVALAAACSSGAANAPSAPGTGPLPSSAPATQTATQAPTDSRVAATATQAVAHLVAGDLSQACLRSLCTEQLASALAVNPPRGTTDAPATTPAVVAVRTVSHDGHIATVDVWIEDGTADGPLRSYRVTLACEADGSWRVAGLTP